jgi:HlyD family secretion protein
MSTASQALERGPETEIGRYLLLSFLTTVGVVAGVGYWLQTATLMSATVSQGTLVVESNVKKVQHQTGGTVGEILVKEGDLVRAGDIVMRLKDTTARSNLQLVQGQLDEQYIRQGRLEAERDKEQEISLVPAVASRVGDPGLAAMYLAERNLFGSRRSARDGQRGLLRERIAQMQDEVKGYIVQQDATTRQVVLLKEELTGLNDLLSKNLVNISRVNSMQRDLARLDGEYGRLVATAAQSRGKIAETELQILQIDQELRSEVVKDLREVQAKVAELVERKLAAEDVLRNIDLRSPENGRVHQMSVHTIGGVVASGEQIMQIVPEKDTLLVEARIAASEIDTIHVGQAAMVKLSAFNARTTPEVEGSVTRMSADLIKDQTSAVGSYVLRIAIPAAELKRAGDPKLLPGMPVEVHLRGTERTALSYFMKPLLEQFGRTFRER